MASMCAVASAMAGIVLHHGQAVMDELPLVRAGQPVADARCRKQRAFDRAQARNQADNLEQPVAAGDRLS
jgi:hypothetical protein